MGGIIVKPVRGRHLGTMLTLACAVGLPPPAAAACCDSADSCERLRAETKALCRPSGASDFCATVDLLAANRLRIHNNDLRPLTQAQKDLAGTYRLDLADMALANEWVVGDAPGISRPGRSVLRVKRVCADAREIEIVSSLYWMTFTLTLDTQGATRGRGEQPLRGFEARFRNERYFFSLEGEP